MSGTSDTIRDRIKEAVGAVTDNQHLTDEGQIDQASGKLKKAGEGIINKARKISRNL
jgi:uncharacterized protein YjbJ (UPF0337 family)